MRDYDLYGPYDSAPSSTSGLEDWTQTSARRVRVSVRGAPQLTRTFEFMGELSEWDVAQAFAIATGHNFSPERVHLSFRNTDDSPWATHPGQPARVPWGTEEDGALVVEPLAHVQLKPNAPMVSILPLDFREPTEYFNDRWGANRGWHIDWRDAGADTTPFSSFDPDAEPTLGHEPTADPEPEATPPWWQANSTPFHIEHVQHELELAFGYASKVIHMAGAIATGHQLSLYSPLVGLAKGLDPAGRLALRHHLLIHNLSEKPVFSEAEVKSLTGGLRWCAAWLGPEGKAQSDDGWVSTRAKIEAEEALGWTGGNGDFQHFPRGENMWQLMRTWRFARRFRGEVLLTQRGKDLETHPRSVVSEMATVLQQQIRESVPQTLALLSIADGSAFDANTLIDQVCILSQQLSGFSDGFEPYLQKGMSIATWAENAGVAFGGRDPRTIPRDESGNWVHSCHPPVAATQVANFLAPFTDRDHYGEFTPAIRKFARLALI